MLISIRHIEKSRVSRWCFFCETGIPVGSRVTRFFGMADRGDTPYAVYEHPECTTKRVGLKQGVTAKESKI